MATSGTSAESAAFGHFQELLEVLLEVLLPLS